MDKEMTPSQVLLVASIMGKMVFTEHYTIIKSEFAIRYPYSQFLVRVVGKRPGGTVETSGYGVGRSLDLAAEVAANEFIQKAQDADVFVGTVSFPPGLRLSDEIYERIKLLCGYEGCKCLGLEEIDEGKGTDGLHRWKCFMTTNNIKFVGHGEDRKSDIAKLKAAYDYYHQREMTRFSMLPVLSGSSIEFEQYESEWKPLEHLHVTLPPPGPLCEAFYAGLCVMGESLENAVADQHHSSKSSAAHSPKLPIPSPKSSYSAVVKGKSPDSDLPTCPHRIKHDKMPCSPSRQPQPSTVAGPLPRLQLYRPIHPTSSCASKPKPPQ